MKKWKKNRVFFQILIQAGYRPLRAGICRFRDPFSDLDFAYFSRTLKICTLDIGPIPCPGTSTDHFELYFRSDVRDTLMFLGVLGEAVGRSPSLRAPAAHGVSSLYIDPKFPQESKNHT